MSEVAVMTKAQENSLNETEKAIHVEQSHVSLIPEVSDDYVQWGHFNTVRRVIESNKFYPVWLTGLSGNGKTQMVEQACACAGLPEKYFTPIPEDEDENVRRDLYLEKQKMLTDLKGQYGREFVRVNFTVETDESQLIGGFRLVDGDTVFQEGPVVEALRRGAVLLLDEVDVAHTNKIMCLQSVLEGKGVFIKDTNEFVRPAKGFTVFATSNTKGRGSTDGRFIGTNMMNGAFLDRFAGMIYQDYPPKTIEDEILNNYFFSYFIAESDVDLTKEQITESKVFIAKLTDWSELIRENYKDGVALEVITTRTLINIIQGYAILGDKYQAIAIACERYEDTVRDQFIEYYSKIDETVYGNATKTETDEKSGIKIEETDTHINISSSNP